ncbi:MAG: hypothetical protein LBL44_05030 [Treponema sp.]|jgi:hypothetical protein|nr:hypothetical protein [Treponema sp.]
MNTLLKAVAGFLMNPVKRGLLLLVLMGLFVAGEFMVSGLVRRTFVFYSIQNGETTVEERMLRRSSSGETDIRRYVEEALLGPVSPDSAPLFPRDTRLVSFMYRDGVVYAGLSEGAVLPPAEGGDVYRNFVTLYRGIRRNFPRVRDVRLFAAGKEAFFEDFRRMFSEENTN